MLSAIDYKKTRNSGFRPGRSQLRNWSTTIRYRCTRCPRDGIEGFTKLNVLWITPLLRGPLGMTGEQSTDKPQVVYEERSEAKTNHTGRHPEIAAEQGKSISRIGQG
jgi:hypothetical protein